MSSVDSKPHSLLLTVLDDMGEFTNDLPRHRQGSYGGDLRTAKEQAVGLVEQLEALREELRRVADGVVVLREDEIGTWAYALVSNPAKCPNCKGHGDVMNWLVGAMERCPKCGGSGEAQSPAKERDA